MQLVDDQVFAIAEITLKSLILVFFCFLTVVVPLIENVFTNLLRCVCLKHHNVRS